MGRQTGVASGGAGLGAAGRGVTGKGREARGRWARAAGKKGGSIRAVSWSRGAMEEAAGRARRGADGLGPRGAGFRRIPGDD